MWSVMIDWLAVFICLKRSIIQYNKRISNKQQRQTANEAQNAYRCWLPVQLKQHIRPTQLYKGKKSRGFLWVVGDNTYSDGSIEQATSRSAGDNSEYRVDNRRRRSNADGRWTSRQPESRSHRTTIHRPAQRSTQCLFAPDRKSPFTSSRLN